MAIKLILWTMMATQMAAWVWLQLRGGKMKNKQYLIFCGMMMTGQTGAAIECTLSQAWGTLAVQIFFFIFTGVGAIQRYRQMRNEEVSK